MIAPIAPVAAPVGVEALRPAATPRGGSAFQDVFSKAVETVESFNHDASAAVERFLSGEDDDLHTTILATQRAELAFDMFLQARNKVVSAYQEIMRMQV